MKVDPMTGDYSKILPSDVTSGASSCQRSTLATLGWEPYFANQISVDELAETPPVRIVEVLRNTLHIIGEGINETIATHSGATVGDWLLFDREHPQSSRILDRKSLLKRRASGTDRQV